MPDILLHSSLIHSQQPYSPRGEAEDAEAGAETLRVHKKGMAQ